MAAKKGRHIVAVRSDRGKPNIMKAVFDGNTIVKKVAALNYPVSSETAYRPD